MITPALRRLSILSFLFGSILFTCSLPSGAQPDNIRFQHIGPWEGLSKFMIFDIYQDVHGFLWFENFKYDGREIKSYPKGNATAVRVGELLADNWGGEPDSLFYYDPLRDAFIDNYPSSVRPLYGHANVGWGLHNCNRCQLKYNDQNLWFGTANEGLFIYQRPAKSFKRIRHRAKDPSSLSSDRISTMLKDQKERIWIGTWNAGLNLWLKDSSFLQFRHEAEDPNSLSSDSITIMKEDRQGFIWIGTVRGLNRLNPTTGEIRRIPLPDSIPPTIINMFIDSAGKLWIGITGERALIYDPASNAFQLYFDKKKEQPFSAYANNQIFSVAEDNQHRIWVGTAAGGVYVYSPWTKEGISYQFDPQDSESISDNNIRAILKDSGGRIWIGTFNGVNMYDPNAKTFVHLESDKEGKYYFNSRPKYSGLEDRKGNIWIASYGGGLIKFDPETENFRIYNKGASNSFIRGNIIKVVEDNSGNIWISTTAKDVPVIFGFPR